VALREVAASPYHRLRIAAVLDETPDAKSLVFECPRTAAGRESFAYRPGQFLTLRIPQAQGSIARCYSLASSPFTDTTMKVTVKRVAGGRGSNWVCDSLAAGDEIEVLPPAGVFSPRSLDGDFLLFAGGSGITPVMSILKSALAQGRGQVVLVYANRDERAVIFRAELAALAAAYPERLIVHHWLESVQGLPSQQQLMQLARPWQAHESFICGPGPFMDGVAAALAALGFERSRVHFEKFVSLGSDPGEIPAPIVAPGDGPVSQLDVLLDGQTRRLDWPEQAALLDVLLSAGLNPPYSCREGRCSACMCRVSAGQVAMRRNEVLDARDVEDGWILACQSLPRSPALCISFDNS
jgi:3-ketosteroid 9alpha-monooxygenase subunit B